MPAAVIQSFAKRSNLPEKRVEELYVKATKLVEQSYKLTKEDGQKFYALVVGILKKMCKIKDDVTVYICEICKSTVHDTDNFCIHCGRKFLIDTGCGVKKRAKKKKK